MLLLRPAVGFVRHGSCCSPPDSPRHVWEQGGLSTRVSGAAPFLRWLLNSSGCSVLVLYPKTHLNLLHGNEREKKLLSLRWFYLFSDLF